MLRLNILFTGLGIVLGVIISNIFITSEKLDMDVLSSTIVSEIMALQNQKATSQHIAQKTTEDEQGFQQDNIDMMKQVFQETAEVLVKDLVQEQIRILERLEQTTLATGLENTSETDNRLADATIITDQERAAIEQTNYILEDAITSGSWDESNSQSYQTALQKLSEKEQYEARVKLSAAINDGLISIENAMNIMF